MLQIEDLSYSIGELRLLQNIRWNIRTGVRTALIGPNGAGKTTLLRILNGDVPDYSGRILKPRAYRIGYLPQEEIAGDHGFLLDTVLEGHREIVELERKIAGLHERLESDAANHETVLGELSRTEARFAALGGYHLETEARRILSGLGFVVTDFQRPVSDFSGGWRMRAYLARLLLQKPDLLLLDEPTNHLDLVSLEWLEQYLLHFAGSMILVSHDRFFIDRLALEIAELEHGRLSLYAGNYHGYENEKEQRRQLLEKKAREQQAELERQQEFIERFRYKATKARQVQSRIKLLDKVERIELPQASTKAIHFRLSVVTPGYKDVLRIRDCSFRYDRDWIFERIRLDLYRGDRAALVGPNGSGKTTLTRLIAGQLTPAEGTVETGQRTVTGYYAQHQVDALKLDADVYDEILSTAADAYRTHVRDILGAFRFSGDAVYKKIRVLSGGEKARVSLAKILVSTVNFLIMDEPTNHLDAASREALETALSGYDGTLLIISHDRYFLDKLVHKVFEIRDRSIREYEGNYSDYLVKREAEQAALQGSGETAFGSDSKTAAMAMREEKKSVKRETNRLKKAIDCLEKEIASMEARKGEIELEMAKPETYRDGEGAARLQKEYERINHGLRTFLAQWEGVHLELEAVEEKTSVG